MKKIIILLVLVVSTSLSFGQKIKTKEANFRYTKLPLSPLDNSIENYYTTVKLDYKEAIDADKLNLQKEYEQELAQYPQKLEDAKLRHKDALARYDKQMEVYNEKSNGKKFVEKQLLNEDSKPRHPGSFYAPSKPVLKKLDHQVVFKEDLLANRLKVYGFKKSEENALKVTVTLYGYENMDIELKQKEKSHYDSKLKRSIKTIDYWYELRHKHPIHVLAETPDGEVLIDEIFNEFNEYSVYRSNTLNNRRPSLGNSFYKKAQRDIVSNNMEIIKDYINDNYGFPVVKRRTQVYHFKARKKNYDDFIALSDLAIDGYNKIVTSPEVATTKITEAIKGWDVLVSEVDPLNKKARISQKVARNTLLNLVEATIWINDFEKSKEYLTKINHFSPTKSTTREAEAYKVLIKDLENRFEVNKQQ